MEGFLVSPKIRAILVEFALDVRAILDAKLKNL